MWTMDFEGEVLESFPGLSWSLSKDHNSIIGKVQIKTNTTNKNKSHITIKEPMTEPNLLSLQTWQTESKIYCNVSKEQSLQLFLFTINLEISF